MLTLVLGITIGAVVTAYVMNDESDSNNNNR